jgi:predicted GH43/DUF377 family glycosyl hydrolase
METIEQVKPEDIVGLLHSSPIIKRHPNNPVFTAKEISYPSVSAYNAGVVKYQGQYVMVFRSGLFYACKTRELCAYNVNSSRCRRSWKSMA